MPLSGIRLLILEDEVLIAMDLEQLCRDYGAGDVMTCRSVTEVGDPAGRFDAAIIDVMLGGETTLGFARRLSDLGTPFVFATGYADASSMLADFAGTPVIPKPYSSTQVIEALDRALMTRAKV